MCYEKVQSVVADSGIWKYGSKASHGFILSPSFYRITEKQRKELEVLGQALHNCLGGLGKLAVIASNPQIAHGATWGMIGRILRTGVPKTYQDIQLLKPGKVPAICKVDIMQKNDGTFQIAEIDGHNKHGLGYSTLAARIRQGIVPQADVFPGVTFFLAQEVKKINEKKEGKKRDSLVLLYASQESFYLPEFMVLQSEFKKHGINLIVVAEKSVRVEDNKIFFTPDGEQYDLLLDFPFLYHHPKLNARLADLYSREEIDFLIPPKPFLGSKAVLALLRNDIKNEELESILKSQISASSLEFIRKYIPETYLIHRMRSRSREQEWRKRFNGKLFVIKESISSGMKGLAFKEDSCFDDFFSRACNSYYRFIMQEEVTNQPQCFEYFTDDGIAQKDEWYMRITVHYATRQIADIIVTARRDKKVHGALDCLQLGTVVA